MIFVWEALKFLVNPLNWGKILSFFGWIKSGVSSIISSFQKKQIENQSKAQEKKDEVANDPKQDLAKRAEAICAAEKELNPNSNCDKPTHVSGEVRS